MLGQYLVKYHSRPFYIEIVCFSLIKNKGKIGKKFSMYGKKFSMFCSKFSMIGKKISLVKNSIFLVKNKFGKKNLYVWEKISAILIYLPVPSFNILIYRKYIKK